MCTHIPGEASHADAPEAVEPPSWGKSVIKTSSPPVCTGGKLPSRRESGDSPHPITPERESHGWGWYEGGGVYSRLTSFPLGVCREDGSLGVLDSIHVNRPVITNSIPVILTDDGYFICFPLLIGCCEADLEVTVRTSASWESSDCSTGVNDCNIWVWLQPPPGC